MVLGDMKTEVSLKCYYIPVNCKGIHRCWVNDFITKPILNFNKAVVIITSFLCNEINYFHVQHFKASDFVHFLPKTSFFVLLFLFLFDLDFLPNEKQKVTVRDSSFLGLFRVGFFSNCAV